MKFVLKTLAVTIIAVFIAATISFAWLLYDWKREMSPSTYLHWLNTKAATYETVDTIVASDLQWYAYAYDENKFVNAIPDATRLPNVADTNGRLPAFKLESDIFVVTWKWVNSSAGIAISNSPDLIARVTKLDNCFRVRHVTGNIYEWDLDLETPSPGENRR